MLAHKAQKHATVEPEKNALYEGQKTNKTSPSTAEIAGKTEW